MTPPRSARLSVAAAAAVAVTALAGCAGSDDTASDASTAGTTTTRSAAASSSTPASIGRPQSSARVNPAATARLHVAASNGDVAEVHKAIADGADLESRGANGRTPLVAATKNRDAASALALLDAGADPNAKDDLQDSAFLYAGAEGFDTILEGTLRHGADVTSLNRYGGTALIPASEHAHTSTISILIKAGVPLDVVNKSGWTALLEAVVLGDGDVAHVDAVRQLLDAGADPSIGDFDGVTPRQHAVDRGQTAVVAEFDRPRPKR
ncbi:ankyrin repeat domain-containing protein [Gordonia sp. PDNC005]|uniref:ankyrin repeat domain-containing protein n=1 Tax=unclassified Gordonia (in: high G+C Gram-positive bacteria) TaxID=2657482 RepID=UPI0019668D6E|nr:ankyrin repeat domain-containing protein [Gordonia sp. PDNC005]QRY61700.1 ankyrin repeat domain-containing protein [Gordonia sp. PDNC005]